MLMFQSDFPHGPMDLIHKIFFYNLLQVKKEKNKQTKQPT